MDLRQLRASVGLRPVEERLGVALRPGKNVRCPFHEDSTPSFGPYDAPDGTTRFKCFGCGWEGDVFDFVAKKDGIELSEAIRRLKPGESRESIPVKAESKEPKELKFTITQVEAAAQALESSPEAQQYLAGRGISIDTARPLRMGFDPARYFVSKGGELPAIVIPDFHQGKLAGVKFRSIQEKYFTHADGSSQNGLFNRDGLDPFAEDVLVFEGPLDAALAMSFGFNAVAVQSTTSKLGTEDFDALKQYRRIYLVGDSDAAGQKLMAGIAEQLPARQAVRVRLRGAKDIGELYAKDAAEFSKTLRAFLRSAETARPNFEWDDLETESELRQEGDDSMPYLVDGLIPLDDLTMFNGQEGSCKSLLALYIGKCVANGAPVFGCLSTKKKPVLYLDAENPRHVIRLYLSHFERVGPEEIRFRTRRNDTLTLSDPALLRVCEEKRPLLVVDSLIRFSEGKEAKDTTPMTEIMGKLLKLVDAGATVILIHHSTKADEEMYANSLVIGATISFRYAIVKTEEARTVRVQMLHKKTRGTEPTNRNLIAFPPILDLGMFVLDGDVPRTDMEIAVEFVRSRGRCNFTAIRQGLQGIGTARKQAALAQAVKNGQLLKSRVGKETVYVYPDAQDNSTGDLLDPESETLISIGPGVRD